MDLRRRVSNMPAASSGFSFKNYDAYAKPLEDFRIKTNTGATISIASIVVICFLLISEFADWIKVELQPSMQVDMSRKERMQINLDMTFPNIPCFILSIDVMDVSGEHQNGVDHSMHKSRLSPTGQVIEKKPQKLGGDDPERDAARNRTKSPDYCGSCYGAPTPANGCCNTCDDVRAAYRIAGWGLKDPERFEQCKQEGFSKLVEEQSHEGCRIDGYIKVSKVQGNFHFAPGPSFEVQGMHAHDLNDYKSHEKDWKFSHKINHLSFGASPDGFKNPLDGVAKTAPRMYETYMYFIKVVATEIQYLNGKKLMTNQFSTTEHARDVTPAFGGMPVVMPGVFFNYDISPMLVKYKEYRKPLSHFITDVCAVVGGVFTVAGIIDSLLYSAEKRIGRRNSLDYDKSS